MSTRTKRKPINSPPHMVALHEAAHAVMALVVGGTVKEVSLAANPERGWAAYTDVKWNGQTEWPEVFMQYLAGYAAEITLCRLSRWHRRKAQHGAANDIERTLRIAKTLTFSEGERSALVTLQFERTKTLVKELRRPIRAVARELLTHKALSGKQVLAILKEAA